MKFPNNELTIELSLKSGDEGGENGQFRHKKAANM
jgi:hypothetical protein